MRLGMNWDASANELGCPAGYPVWVPYGNRGQNPAGSRRVSRTGPVWPTVRVPYGSRVGVLAGQPFINYFAIFSDGHKSILKIDFYFQNRKYYFILYFQNTFGKYFAKVFSK